MIWKSSIFIPHYNIISGAIAFFIQIMLWQIPLLLLLLSANHITAAAVITHKGNDINAITLPLKRTYISNERFKARQKRSVESEPLINKITQVRNYFIQ
jgi:hypothetical protein